MLLVVITTVAVYTFVFSEISDSFLMPSGWTADLNPASSQTIPADYSSGLNLRVLLLLSAGLLVIIMLSVIWLRMAMHRINRPIQAIHRAVFRLSQGKLNETITIESADEFGQIGSSINELAANLQELLLYIWKQTGQCISSLEQIKHIPGLQERTASSKITDEHLRELTEAVESLREMAKSYVFYDVRLEGEKTLAINHPGQNGSTDPPSS